jgi:hypothetical protein
MTLLIGKKTSKYRTENISIARNKILDHIRNNVYLSQYTYMIMMDYDDVCSSKINLESIFYVLSKSDQWDSCSFHRKHYYDIWALSYSPFMISCWHWNKAPIEFIKKKITNILETMSKNDFYPVYSAFNGFAIYKLSLFLQCHYEGNITKSMSFLSNSIIELNKKALHSFTPLNISDGTKEDCEHRYFHFQAVFQYNAKIVISPRLIF